MESTKSIYNMPLTSIDVNAVKLPSTKEVKKKQKVEEKKKTGTEMDDLYKQMGGCGCSTIMDVRG